ncbi:MAG: hypothetical protein JNM67_11345 [Bacteroidetes bacterium]|nr:hypothetical protein [Bacteroidota bacterium]
MKEVYKKDIDFKVAIGEFVIAFSKLEFGLNSLCALTEFDIRKKDEYYIRYMGFPFEKKLEILESFIEENTPELKVTWDMLKSEIKSINSERRYLIHGIHNYSFPKETIQTFVKRKKVIVPKKFSLRDIKSLTNKIYEICTGKNGITGEFNSDFTKVRVNQWNQLVLDKNKIVFKLNNKIVSDWKGS